MHTLSTEADLTAALAESEQRPVLMFKHSTQCPISAAAYQEVQTFEQHQSQAVYMVKVIEDRPLSNHMAELFNVRHASPQALLVHRGNVVWHVSHYDITEQAVTQAFQTVNPA